MPKPGNNCKKIDVYDDAATKEQKRIYQEYINSAEKIQTLCKNLNSEIDNCKIETNNLIGKLKEGLILSGINFDATIGEYKGNLTIAQGYINGALVLISDYIEKYTYKKNTCRITHVDWDCSTE